MDPRPSPSVMPLGIYPMRMKSKGSSRYACRWRFIKICKISEQQKTTFEQKLSRHLCGGDEVLLRLGMKLPSILKADQRLLWLAVIIAQTLESKR
jgi:hypothetical protein